MRSTKNTGSQHRSFIEQARRDQMVEATIKCLAKHGYVKTSLARIASEIDISPSLIAYHFSNKQELTSEVFACITKERATHMRQQLASAPSASDKLRIALETDIAYMTSRPERFQAMAEILFGQRSKNGTMTYMSGTPNPMFNLIQTILEEGQRSGEFGDFDAQSLALIIEGGRDSFLALVAVRPGFDVQKFTQTLIDVAQNMTKKETKRISTNG